MNLRDVVFKTGVGERSLTKMEKRVALIPDYELAQWADSIVMGIGRNLDDWRRDHDITAIAEAQIGADALQVTLKEIQRRFG